MLRFPPKRVLVPIDFTPASWLGFEHARLLAERFGSELEALYVENLLPAGEFGFVPRRLDKRMKREILSQLRERVGEKARLRVLEGDPVVTILRLARARRPDLIVMGTHGRRGFERIWLGSVSEAVARLSPVPVLVVRSRPRPVRSVLSPVHFTSYSEYGYGFAAALASAWRAPLRALHVCDEPRPCSNARYRLLDLARRLPPGVRRLAKPPELGEGRAVDAILAAADPADWIVLVAHRKSILKDMVLGTTMERVLRHSPAPVLAVPAPRRIPAGRWLLEEGKV